MKSRWFVAGLVILTGIVLGGAGFESVGQVKPQDHSRVDGATRVMTYNIQWFNKGASDERIANLKQILDEVKPDILGVQEVEGKAAMQRILGSDWVIEMADLPEEFQEVGIAVRAPYKIEKAELLFTSKSLDYAFPGNRDVMRAEVRTPDGKLLVCYVNHFKSRGGGRMTTDGQREMAAGLLAAYIAAKGDENVVVMGDFNDAPNDRMANILETGNTLALGGDKTEYKLLTNLVEPLADKDWVTLGMEDLYFGEGYVRAVVPGAKADNDRLRGKDYRFPDDVKVTQACFDQILVSPNLAGLGAKATIYDGEAAMRGLRGRVRVIQNDQTGARAVEYTEQGSLASDHLPVYADIKMK